MVSTYVRDALEMGSQDSGSAPSFSYLPTHRSEGQARLYLTAGPESRGKSPFYKGLSLKWVSP